MNTFLVAYRHMGEQYVVELKAANQEDAKQRLASLSKGEILGAEVERKRFATRPTLSDLVNAFAGYLIK